MNLSPYLIKPNQPILSIAEFSDSWHTRRLSYCDMESHMLGLTNYYPPNKEDWLGRTDLPPNSCIYQTIQLLDLNHLPKLKHANLAFAIVGFNCDEGIRRNQGRMGAKEGPKQLREVLAKMPVPREDVSLYDAGDIVCEDQQLEKAQEALSNAIQLLQQQHIIPLVIGGGHELAWGHYQGLARTQAPQSIVNFDAHFDMRPLLAEKKGSSGTPFLQIAQACAQVQQPFNYHCIGIQTASNIPLLFDTAKEYNVQVITADEVQSESQRIQQYIETLIAKTSSIYTSICLDVFATPYAPGVSAPQALGLTPWQVIPLLRQLSTSGKVISYDLAELSPKYDIDQRTAKLAANLVFDIILHHAQ